MFSNFYNRESSKTQWIRKWKCHFCLKCARKWQIPISISPLQLPHSAVNGQKLYYNWEQLGRNMTLLTMRNTFSLNLSNWGDEKVTELCGPGRNMVWVPNKSNRTFPQIWWWPPVLEQNCKFPARWNMKSSREKSDWWFPQIWWSQWVTLQLWSGFLTLCEGKNTRKPV